MSFDRPTSYKIAINELQRSVIEEALRAFAKPGLPDYSETREDEAKVLLSLFADLSEEDAKANPNMVYGFAL